MRKGKDTVCKNTWTYFRKSAGTVEAFRIIIQLITLLIFFLIGIYIALCINELFCLKGLDQFYLHRPCDCIDFYEYYSVCINVHKLMQLFENKAVLL